MADMNELYTALQRADMAGDTDGARRLAAYIKSAEAQKNSQAAAEPPSDGSVARQIASGLGNLASGAIRGAGSIGATILWPIDKATDLIKGDRTSPTSLSRNEERRRAMDNGLRDLGADPESLLFRTGKLGGEIAGTAGVGGALANVVKGAAPAAIAGSPRLAQLASALSSSGFTTGAPVASTLAGKAADLGIRAAGGALSGGVSAGLVNPEDAGVGAAIGGGLPVIAKAAGSLGRAIGRAVSGPGMSPEVKSLASRAEQLGIDIPADRLVNSRPLNAVASGLNYVPFSGRAAAEARMQSQFNKALSRTFGQDSDNVTMALRKANEALGSKFDDVLKANNVRVDDQLLSDLANSAKLVADELSPGQASIIAKQIDNIMEKGASGAIDGQTAYNIKKTLDRIGNRNSPEAWYASDVKKKLMDALDRSLGQDAAGSFAKTRREYANMLMLKKLAQNGAEGDVSIASIANMKNIRNQDLQELADISAQFLKQREGQHGAAQRALTGLGLGTLGGPTTFAASILGGRAANASLNSPITRNLLLGRSPTVPAVLLENFYRTAPLLGVSGG